MGFKRTLDHLFILSMAFALVFSLTRSSIASLTTEEIPVLSSGSVEAAGRQEALLKVPAPGRYAVTATSDQGTAIRIINRMTGPGPESGIPGQENGRIDLFLDEGEYKIITRSHKNGSGKAQLKAHTFTELNAPGIPLMVENKPIDEQMSDFEQRSYWLRLTKTTEVIIEAAGRNLSDLRLWKDGSWLYDAFPSTETLDPQPGRPLRVFRLAVKLSQGLYLLTAYGGPAEPWSEADDQHPLYIRYGISRLPEAGRKRFEISPMGIDRFLVPAQANFFRLELPEPVKATLKVGTFSASNPFNGGGQRVTITKEFRLPVAEIRTRSGKGYEIVTVTGTAGQPYILQHFDARDTRQFRDGGAFWLSTIHSGDPRDSVDATALLFEHSPGREPVLRAEDVIELGPGIPWTRRFNLLEEGDVFFKVLQAGKYIVSAPGSDILVKIEPFMITRPRDYREPDFRAPGKTWDLDRGYHVLKVSPLKEGIVTLSISSEKEPSRVVDRFVGLFKGRNDRESPAAIVSTGHQSPSAIFEEVDLEHNTSYTLYINRQPGVRAGMVLRRLPLDLSDALPLSLLPGQSVSIPFVLNRGQGTIRAISEDGAPLEVSLNGKTWSDSVRVVSNGTLQVRNPKEDIAAASVWLEADQDRSETPLPPLPASALNNLSQFTAIDDTAPLYFDLNKKADRTFMIKVRDAGFYNLESTGLLDTEGNVRAKIITSLGRDSGSGTGRNFFLGRYLREGIYQVTVATRGESAGHLGLGLTRSGLLYGGSLREEIPARVTLPEGQGIVYTLDIRDPGTFRMTGYGLDRTLSFRLEDEEGWPLIQPNQPMDRTVELDEGRYRIVLLPEKVQAKRVVLVHRVASTSETTGHGPHVIALNTQYENIWTEPEKGNTRSPDVWTFKLAASADIAVNLTGEMVGKLAPVSGQSRTADVVTVPTTGWEGRLNEGTYRLEAVCSRTNNRVPYQLRISTKTLIPGLSRQATAPVDIPIAVGSGGLVEIFSFGQEDVRTRLVNGEGISVARQDDRPDDWNFQISTRLDPGDYTLEVRPVGRQKASFTATMAQFEESVTGSVKIPARMEITPKDGVTLLPLKIEKTGAISLSAKSGENVGLALEKELDPDRWEAVWSGNGSMVEAVVPLAGQQADWRLRLWSMDRRNLPVSLRIDSQSVTPVTEAKIAKGITSYTSNAPGGAINIVAVETSRPGLFVANSGGRAVKGTDRAFAPLSISGDGFIRAGEQGFWFAVGNPNTGTDSVKTDATQAGDYNMGMNLFSDDSSKSTGDMFRISAERFVLAGSKPVQLALAPAEKVTLDVEGSDGLVLVEANSLGGQPGVRLFEDTGEKDVVMAVAQRSAAAVWLGPGSPSATVFNAGDPSRKIDLKLIRRAYPKPQIEDLKWGEREGLLAEQSAKAIIFKLPAGNKQMRISAERGIAAALLKNNQVLSVSWKGSEPLDEMISSDADQLALMLTGDSAARYALQVFSQIEEDSIRPVTVASPMERLYMDSGTARVRIEGLAGARLKIGGVIEKAVLVTSPGRVLEGSDFPLDREGSELIFHHGPGHVLAWIEDDDGNTGLWGSSDPIPGKSVSKPDVVPLSGDSSAIEFSPGEPSVVHIRTTEPVVIRSIVPGAADRTKVHPHGGRLDLYLPQGSGKVWIRGIRKTGLRGSAYISFTQVIRTGEGLGPEVLIPGGESRYFVFTTTRRGQVGIGVRGDSDVVRCLLQDRAGNNLGEGVVQMPTLDPGDYLIRLSVPPTVEPVKAKPAVVGLTLPGTGPPEEEIRKYLELAGTNGGQ